MVLKFSETDVRKQSKFVLPADGGTWNEKFCFLASYKFDWMTSSAEKKHLSI